jgi:hypothetical protein
MTNQQIRLQEAQVLELGQKAALAETESARSAESAGAVAGRHE